MNAKSNAKHMNVALMASFLVPLKWDMITIVNILIDYWLLVPYVSL